MTYFIFTRDILAGKPIRIFNHGNMKWCERATSL